MEVSNNSVAQYPQVVLNCNRNLEPDYVGPRNEVFDES